MELFLIQGLDEKYRRQTIKSLKETISDLVDIDKEFNITTVKEKETREETLNAILEMRNPGEDLFVVADDIIFLPKWYEGLKQNLKNGHIIGFSMLYPQSDIISDYGYDFVKVDNVLTYRGKYKHTLKKDAEIQNFRECDAICGCAMYIKKEVLKEVDSFSADGQNRWGEIIFCQKAREKGYKTIVLGSHLWHYGISSKNTQRIKTGSLSFIIERDLWQKVVDKYFCNVNPEINIKRIIAPELKNLIKGKRNILFYGSGTICEFLIQKLTPEQYSICSALKEEEGIEFMNRVILNAKTAINNFKGYDLAVITPVGYNDKIVPLFKNFSQPVVSIVPGQSRDEIIYSFKEEQPFFKGV
jgi:hypothetical protein